MRTKIVMTRCKRCGKKIAMTDKSLYGLEHLKAKWSSICEDCITTEERVKMLTDIGKSLKGGGCKKC